MLPIRFFRYVDVLHGKHKVVNACACLENKIDHLSRGVADILLSHHDVHWLPDTLDTPLYDVLYVGDGFFVQVD